MASEEHVVLCNRGECPNYLGHAFVCGHRNLGRYFEKSTWRIAVRGIAETWASRDDDDHYWSWMSIALTFCFFRALFLLAR